MLSVPVIMDICGLTYMLAEYQHAVSEGRSILGHMGYSKVISNIMLAMDCSFDDTKTIFGRMGYSKAISNIVSYLV